MQLITANPISMPYIHNTRASTKISQQFIADGEYTIPNGILVDVIELRPAANMVAVSIGITPAGEEILPATALVAYKFSEIGTLIKGPTTLYFSGITAPLQIIFYRR